MKLIKKINTILLLAVVSFLAFGCSSDNSSSSNNNQETTFYLKCKVNGVQFTSSDPMVINSMAKSITAVSVNNATHQETVSLMMPLNVTVGTHTITEEPSNENSYWGGYADFDNDISTQDSSGTMTITQVTADVIKGTFAFTSPDFDGNIITVTEGTFRAENIQ